MKKKIVKAWAVVSIESGGLLDIGGYGIYGKPIAKKGVRLVPCVITYSLQAKKK